MKLKLKLKLDFLLRYRRDFPLAVVEAKASYRRAADAVQQARQYAEMLGLKFAYATNGAEIIEIDYFTGAEAVEAELAQALAAAFQRITAHAPAPAWATSHRSSGAR